MADQRDGAPPPMVVRLVREINLPGSNGPDNGMYALQRLLRDRVPWLNIGGELQPSELPWYWWRKERSAAVRRHEQGRPFIIGPNIFFDRSREPRHNGAERTLLDSPYCRLIFTESAWYRDLIDENRGSENRAPIVVWSYPIGPQPDGPLPADCDLLIYAKSGYTEQLIGRLQRAFPLSVLFRYGRYQRAHLIAAARRSQCCAYLSDDDRGPLALAEILITGCPAVGVARGAPWCESGLGRVVGRLAATELIGALCDVAAWDRQAVRAAALRRFDSEATVCQIVKALAVASAVA